jgi:hypothetical protein
MLSAAAGDTSRAKNRTKMSAKQRIVVLLESELVIVYRLQTIRFSVMLAI